MIVQCISFGTPFWFRPATDETTGALVLAKSAYYNTSGFLKGTNKNKFHYNHISPGFVRINAKAVVFSDPSEILQAQFLTPGVERYMDSSRLLLQKKMPGSLTPDAYLVAIHSDREGPIDFKRRWRTEGVRVVARSIRKKDGQGPAEETEMQETLVVIPAGGRVYTNLGAWEVVWKQNKSLLALVED